MNLIIQIFIRNCRSLSWMFALAALASPLASALEVRGEKVTQADISMMPPYANSSLKTPAYITPWDNMNTLNYLNALNTTWQKIMSTCTTTAGRLSSKAITLTLEVKPSVTFFFPSLWAILITSGRIAPRIGNTSMSCSWSRQKC